MANKYAAEARAARKAERRRQGCERKRYYATEAAAADNIPKDQRPYDCGYCDGWHRATDPAVKLARNLRRAAGR